MGGFADAIVISAGSNGLVRASYIARAGRAVLERSPDSIICRAISRGDPPGGKHRAIDGQWTFTEYADVDCEGQGFE